VSLTKVNYPAGALVTAAPWDPKMDASLANKPVGQILFSRWSIFLPLSVDEGLKEAVTKAGGKTLTNVRVHLSSLLFINTLQISGEISKK
jgi:hypothetical protein